MTRNRTQTEIFLDKKKKTQHIKFQMFSLTHLFAVIAMSRWVPERLYYQSVGASFRDVNPHLIETMD